MAGRKNQEEKRKMGKKGVIMVKTYVRSGHTY
jgi:hypothetical protein